VRYTNAAVVAVLTTALLTIPTPDLSAPTDTPLAGAKRVDHTWHPPKPRPKPKPKPRPKPAPSRSYVRPAPRHTAVNWDAIAKCESGNHWNHHSATAGLYWGGLQMDMTFWRHNGGLAYAARPDLATRAQQIAVAEVAYKSRGLRPWPTCGRYG
jgi:hypothetical protein